jgi:hypothetical protein
MMCLCHFLFWQAARHNPERIKIDLKLERLHVDMDTTENNKQTVLAEVAGDFSTHFFALNRGAITTINCKFLRPRP